MGDFARFMGACLMVVTGGSAYLGGLNPELVDYYVLMAIAGGLLLAWGVHQLKKQEG